MQLLGNHFIYNGVDSMRYGMIFVNKESDEFLNLCNSPTANTIFNRQSNKSVITGDDYADANLSFDIAVMNENATPYSSSEQRKIKRWLFTQSDYRKLYINRYDDPDSYEITDSGRLGTYLNCRFTNPSEVISGTGVVGYQFTIECDSSMAWQDPTTKTFTAAEISSAGENGVIIEVDSDFSGYTYPRVDIKISGKEINVCNMTDDSNRATAFKLLEGDNDNALKGDLIINSNTNFVSGDNYKRFVGQNFPRLLNGENRLKITGNIEKITFTWVNRRFL